MPNNPSPLSKTGGQPEPRHRRAAQTVSPPSTALSSVSRPSRLVSIVGPERRRRRRHDGNSREAGRIVVGVGVVAARAGPVPVPQEGG